MPWISRKELAERDRLHAADITQARLEERRDVLLHIQAVLDTPGEGAMVAAAKLILSEVGERLCERWDLKDSAEIFKKWGVRT